MDKARKDLTVVRSKDAEIDPEARCYSAQAATEKSLKALLVAHGQPVRAEHDLEVFADELRALGEVLPAVATAQELKRLAEYAGAAQYPGWAGETTEADAARFCEIAVQGVRAGPGAGAADPASARAAGAISGRTGLNW